MMANLRRLAWQYDLSPEQTRQVEELCKSYRPLMLNLASRLYRLFIIDQAIEVQDLVQHGCIGVIEACMRHWKRNGTGKIPYINLFIKNKMLEFLMQNGRKKDLRGTPLLVIGVGESAMLEYYEARYSRVRFDDTVLDQVENRLDTDCMKKRWGCYVERLSSRDRVILELRLGKQQTLAEISEVVPLTRERIRQIVKHHVEQFGNMIKMEVPHEN